MSYLYDFYMLKIYTTPEVLLLYSLGVLLGYLWGRSGMTKTIAIIHRFPQERIKCEYSDDEDICCNINTAHHNEHCTGRDKDQCGDYSHVNSQDIRK